MGVDELVLDEVVRRVRCGKTRQDHSVRVGRFEATKHPVGGIAYPAHKYGRLLYQAA